MREDYLQVHLERDVEGCVRDHESGATAQQLSHRPPWLMVFAWVVSIAATALVTTWVNGRAGREEGRSAVAALGTINLASSPMPSFYGLYQANFRDARYIDLTHPFGPKGPVWDGFGKIKAAASRAGNTMEGFVNKGDEFTYLKQGFIATAYTLTTDQYGTQLDPPAHWNEFGATISDLPASFTLRPLVVVDIVKQVSKNASYHATVDDVKAWEASYCRVPNGSAVFFRSGWSKKWSEYQQKGAPTAFPGVKLDTLKFLHHQRGILFHGHEPLDTDGTASLEGEAWLMHNNYAQAEGIANLEGVPMHGCLLSIGFAKSLGGSGGYARYVAVCPAGSTTAGTSVLESPGAPLPVQPFPLRRNADGVLTPTQGAEKTKYCSVSGSLGCDSKGPVWKSS